MDTLAFYSNVEKTEGCWEWIGRRNAGGYGLVRWHGRSQYAHRVSLELAGHPVPQGLMALHKCDNPPCVRPDHLYVGTAVENGRDRRERRPRLDPDDLIAALEAAGGVGEAARLMGVSARTLQRRMAELGVRARIRYELEEAA